MSKPTLRNLMNRAINIYPPSGQFISVPPWRGSRMALADASYETVLAPSIALFVPVVTEEFKLRDPLPEPEEGVFYIVPTMVRKACPDRPDLLSPGDKKLDDGGRVIGCQNLVANETIRSLEWGDAVEVQV